jgi:hypothetical protein
LGCGIQATSRRWFGSIASADVTKLLLAVHVLAAIVAIGPVTVAASMFPAAIRRGDRPALRTLHRICRVYAALGVVVPVFGLATATSLGVLGDAWLIASIALTVVAAAVLGLLILPAQATALTSTDAPADDAAFPGDILPGAAVTPTARPTAKPTAVPAAGPFAGPAAEPIAISRGRADAPVTPERAFTVSVDKRAGGAAAARRLGMVTGVFNLLWATVVVLMIVRPGSTTGV